MGQKKMGDVVEEEEKRKINKQNYDVASRSSGTKTRVFTLVNSFFLITSFFCAKSFLYWATFCTIRHQST